jgi:hypothetical protein
MTEPDRLCDFQAMFIIEVFSQYRARRAAKVLSSRFDKVYHKVELASMNDINSSLQFQAVKDFRRVTSQIDELMSSLKQFGNSTPDRWARWVELGTWQRLLLSCYILESQQPLLLGREALPSLIQDTDFDLPFPAHTSLWDATTSDEWALAAQQHCDTPTYVYEATSESMVASFDTFQSSVILAAHYNRHESSTPYLSTPAVLEVEHLLDPNPDTMRTFLTAKLVQVTPLRALLAVAGESWILSEKVATPQAFTAFKTTLRAWLAQLWSTTEPESTPVKQALKLSVDILQQAVQEQRDSVLLGMGTDMGIYFAALVLWAITIAANTRLKGPQPKTQQHQRSLSRSPPIFQSSAWVSLPAATNQMRGLSTSFAPNTTQPGAFAPSSSQPASPIVEPAPDNPLLSHAQITINTISFLSDAPYVFNSAQFLPDLLRHQTGCVSLLLWVKLRLRGVPLEDTVGAANAWAARPGEGLGELLDGVTGSLERVLGRGWGGWGI